MVGQERLELSTSRLSSACSNQLSYWPLKIQSTVLAVRKLEKRYEDSDLPCSITNRTRQTFLRKEVIQPQLPLRLPCYDFVPVASPTFDGCLLAVGPPASGVTDSHDVTGGVYKAREHIHRGVLSPGY